MSKISKETYKKLILIYLIKQFENGIWGNYKFQKSLYYGLEKTKVKPFEFKHTDNGMFSQEAWNIIDDLHTTGIVIDANMGNRSKIWKLNEDFPINEIAEIIETLEIEISDSIKSSVKRLGKMSWRELKKIVESDSILEKIPEGDIIFEANIPEKIDTKLSDADCQDLELALNPYFIQSMQSLVENVNSGGLNLGELLVEI